MDVAWVMWHEGNGIWDGGWGWWMRMMDVAWVDRDAGWRMRNEGGGMRVGGCGMWKYRLVYENRIKKKSSDRFAAGPIGIGKIDRCLCRNMDQRKKKEENVCSSDSDALRFPFSNLFINFGYRFQVQVQIHSGKRLLASTCSRRAFLREKCTGQIFSQIQSL